MELHKNKHILVIILSYITTLVLGLVLGYIIAIAIQHSAYTNYHNIDNKIDEIECVSADHQDCHTEYIYDSASQFIVDDELIYKD